jgi:hypothetical protein
MTTDKTWLRTALLVASLLVAPVGCASSGAHERGDANASIPFLNHDGVRDWQVESPYAMRIESATGQWYRATFYGACPELRFRNSVGFVTDSTHRLDRFSSVIAGGQRCWFRTFERVPDVSDALPAPR